MKALFTNDVTLPRNLNFFYAMMLSILFSPIAYTQIDVQQESPPSRSEMEIRNNFKSEKGEYLNGKKEGEWEYYHPIAETNFRAKIKAKGTYVNGVKEGEWQYLGLNAFYKDTIANYKSGLAHGTWKILQVKRPHTEMEYNMGAMLSRKQIRYNGLLSEETFSDDGSFKIVYYRDSIVRQTKHFDSDSLKTGEWQVFKEKDLHFVEFYNKDTLISKDWFYPSGQLKTKNIFEPEIYGKSYYENGQLKSERIYKNKKSYNIYYFTQDGEVLDNGGFKDGTGLLLHYNQEGKIMGEELYKDQKIVSSKWF